MNLNGEGDILGPKLRIYASNYLVFNNQTCPTGAILPVANTPWILPRESSLAYIDTGFAQLTMVGVWRHDHCFDSSTPIDRARGLARAARASACMGHQ